MSQQAKPELIAEQVEGRIQEEFTRYHKELEGLSGKEVLSKVYEYVDKELIHDSIQSGFLREEDDSTLKILASWPGNLLDSIYIESLRWESLKEISDVISVVLSLAHGETLDLGAEDSLI